MNPADFQAKAASKPVAEHDISVKFDLMNHTLSAVSHIKLPPGQGLELYTGMVTLGTVRLNDKVLPEKPTGDRVITVSFNLLSGSAKKFS